MQLQTLLSACLYVLLGPHLLPHPKVEREVRGEHLKDRNVPFDHLAKGTHVVDQTEAVIVMQERLRQHASELVDCREEQRAVNHQLDKVVRTIQQQMQKLTEKLQLEERSDCVHFPFSHEGEGKFGGGGMSVHAKLKFLREKILDMVRMTNIFSVHNAELELQASLANSFDGTFVWKIPDVSRRMMKAKCGCVASIYSPPFYTSQTGYKMCVRVYLNGDGIGENTHLSLFFVIMKGEYDVLLRWPFDHKVGEAPLQSRLLVGRVTSCYPPYCADCPSILCFTQPLLHDHA